MALCSAEGRGLNLGGLVLFCVDDLSLCLSLSSTNPKTRTLTMVCPSSSVAQSSCPWCTSPSIHWWVCEGFQSSSSSSSRGVQSGETGPVLEILAKFHLSSKRLLQFWFGLQQPLSPLHPRSAGEAAMETVDRCCSSGWMEVEMWWVVEPAMLTV